jgi:hypothetical protein
MLGLGDKNASERVTNGQVVYELRNRDDKMPPFCVIYVLMLLML